MIGLTIALPIICYLIYYNKNNWKDVGTSDNKLPLKPSDVSIEFIIFFGIMTYFIIFCILMSIEQSYVPKIFVHQNQDINNKDINNIMNTDISYINPLYVSPKYWLSNMESQINLTIVPYDKSIKIKSVRLESPPKSIISTNEKFTPKSSKLPKEDSINSSLYQMNITVRNDGIINNTKQNYSIVILYSSDTYKSINKTQIPFPWNIKEQDMALMTYFWIVLAGVLSSTAISMLSIAPEGQAVEMRRSDAIWIALSFIIALAIFSGFNDVKITNYIIFNIGLAFGFGFGSDRILSLAKRFNPDFSVNIEQRIKELEKKLAGKQNEKTDEPQS